MPNFSDIFALEVGVVEMMLRGTVIYWAILILLRLSGRREIGSLGTADLLVLILVADAAGNALSGGSASLTDGVIVVATIVGWSVLLDRVAYRFGFVRRLLDPERVCLIRDGKVVRSGLRSEQITWGELMEQLRLKGVESIPSVKRAYLESNGQFSVIMVGEDVPQEASTLNEHSSTQ